MLLQDEQIAMFRAIVADDADKLQKVLNNEIDVNAPLVSMNTVMTLSTTRICIFM